MSILYDEQNRSFHLSTSETSYIIQIIRDGYLAHRYWGKRIHEFRDSNRLIHAHRPLSPNPDPQDRSFSLDELPQEYPGFGRSDLRTPAYQIEQINGSTTSDLRYVTHRIIKGKPALEQLPAVYMEEDDEAETLEITMKDELLDFYAILSYTVLAQWNVITRSVRFINKCGEKVRLLRAASMNIDFNDANFDLLHLSGAWAKERSMIRRPLFQGNQSVDSRRGASSPHHNPFIALMRKGADESQGDVYGFNLVYSGNFLANVEVDSYDTARVSIGINPFDFAWLLEPGESFQTPEAVMVFSSTGLGGMSRTYHRLYRSRLCRGKYRDLVRPILINNWEATYFDFTAEKLVQIAAKGKELGMELFVLDDGWFGKRNDDSSSLGDWFVNREKLPNGLEDLVSRINHQGMQFGLWFEPEMVSVDSELYRAHPDWCIHVEGRSRTTSRSQLILDLSRPEVCDELVQQISGILQSAPITYVKWDMNRHMTEVGSAGLPAERQRETAHRYILGLYRILEQLTTAFPDVLFESCSSGGGRFDPGMLYYMPQTWTSDNSDAISRLKIQYGTSIVYPVSSIGAHVSDVPNHQVGRITPLETRGHVALTGVFGYELDLTTFNESEQSLVKEQVQFYKEARELVMKGDLYRLLNPFEGNEAAWMVVSEDRTEALLFYCRVLAEPNPGFRSLRLQGLDENAKYIVDDGEMTYGGDELMYAGIRVPFDLHGDFRSRVWRVRKAGKE
ncbi:Alpha-galactosidase AgaA [Paenibacillus auburnensis]|uniref:Alpha-galactosidase n=1 Tax=Paenibacillus auburnensis TaxID=2905649 RepID=A0ABM9CAB5_9BACL|nr:alpha-galactosidase [Paenibacillus auburnensis]CAH1208221.1 Alpha-galactosidase AgaA [Paenibacillus auburnensis]